MMKIIFSLFFLFSIVFFGNKQCVWAHTDVTPQEVKNLIMSNDALMVVDVREEESEYCDENPTPPVPPGHIPGALNYPWSSGVLQERYGELEPEREILLVCRSGNRSNEAADFLDSKGYLSVYDMIDGMGEWKWETAICIDSDEDSINDDLDNCPEVYNPNQDDNNQNGLGDTCDASFTSCSVINIYGENSATTELIRNYRDEKLKKTHEGKKIIELYYTWSPYILEKMEEDDIFKQELKKLIDTLVPVIRGELRIR